MRTLLIAAVALCVSSAAFAKDLKATVMTDSEMDKVTAGGVDNTVLLPGVAYGHAVGATSTGNLNAYQAAQFSCCRSTGQP